MRTPHIILIALLISGTVVPAPAAEEPEKPLPADENVLPADKKAPPKDDNAPPADEKPALRRAPDGVTPDGVRSLIC
jgi:hypothetical protein